MGGQIPFHGYILLYLSFSSIILDEKDQEQAQTVSVDHLNNHNLRITPVALLNTTALMPSACPSNPLLQLSPRLCNAKMAAS